MLGISRHVQLSINSLYKKILTHCDDLGCFIRRFHPVLMSRFIVVLYTLREVFDFAPLRTFHPALFDPAWLCNDGHINRLDPTTVCSFTELSTGLNVGKDAFTPQSFFRGGPFAYHIHLSSVQRVDNDSYFMHFENYFKSRLILPKQK